MNQAAETVRIRKNFFVCADKIASRYLPNLKRNLAKRLATRQAKLASSSTGHGVTGRTINSSHAKWF